MPSDAPPLSQALNDGTVDDLTSASLRSSKTAAAGRTFASSRSERPTSPTCVSVLQVDWLLDTNEYNVWVHVR